MAISLPPELISHILSLLSPSDPLTIPTLLTCTLVSRSFSALALSSPLWTPHALHRWQTPSRPEPDVFSYYKRRALLDREAIEKVHDLAGKANDRLADLERVVWDLGEEVAGALRKLERVGEEEEAEKWLSVRYWSRECRTALGRRKAIEVWKGIKEGGLTGEGDEKEGREEEREFEEGVSAFTAFLDFNVEGVSLWSSSFLVAWGLAEPEPRTRAIPYHSDRKTIRRHVQ